MQRNELDLSDIFMDEDERKRKVTNLFKVYATKVQRFCASHDGVSYEDAQDITQDTFIGAFQSIHRFKPGTNEKSWLMTIAKRKIIGFYRKKNSQSKDPSKLPRIYNESSAGVDLSDTPSGKISPQQQAIKREQLQRLLDAIDNLPKKQSKALKLNVVDDMSPKQVGQQMGITREDANQLIYLGRKKLRKKFSRN